MKNSDFQQSLLLLAPAAITILAIAAVLYFLREPDPSTETPEIETAQIAPESPETAYYPQPDELRKMVDRLAQAESGSNPRAINWKDRDGTASFGCLQFKPTSFRDYGIKYGYFGEKVNWNWLMTAIFDCELQKQIAREMILDPSVDKNKEWPVQWKRVNAE